MNLKRNISNLVYQAKFIKSKREYNKQIKNYLNNNPIDYSAFSKDIIREYKEKWSVFDKKVNLDYFFAYSSIYGKIDVNYVPDYIYRYPIEKILLNRNYSIYAGDKNAFERRFYGKYRNLFPEVFLRKIEGVWYDKNYTFVKNPLNLLLSYDEHEVVLKECIGTGAGMGVYFFKKKNDSFINKNGIDIFEFSKQHQNLIIQKVIKQHENMAKFNKDSINGIRVVTYRSVTTEKVHILQMLIKCGSSGLRVDNLNSGGNFIEINKTTGEVSKHGIDKLGNKVYHNSGVFKINQLSEIKKIAKEIAKQDFYHRQIFYDFYLDENNDVKIMELNYSAHPPIQAICGPAFAEFTDEVIEYCLYNKGHIVLDFEFKL